MNSLRILLFAANPRSDLKLDEEIRAIEKSLNEGKFREETELILSLATRTEDLITKISKHNPSVVHFSGHAMQVGRGDRAIVGGDSKHRDLLPASSSKSDAQILLVDEHGMPMPVSRDPLGELFHSRKGDIRLVVLNACSTRPLAEVISREIDCVIGTNRSIGDEAARVFANRFYRSLADGGSVQRAFEDARLELGLQGIPEGDSLDLVAREGVDTNQMFFVGMREDAKTKHRSDNGRVSTRARSLKIFSNLPSLPRSNSRSIALVIGAMFLTFALFAVFMRPLADWIRSSVGVALALRGVAPPTGNHPTKLGTEGRKEIVKSGADQNVLTPPIPPDGPRSAERSGIRECYSSSIKVRKALWPRGVIPYSNEDDDIPPSLRQTIEEAVQHWNQATNRIFFRPRAASDAYYVEFAMPADRPSSVGKDIDRGAQKIRVSADCSFDNIVHELGHCIGLFDEHTRGDRDDYLEIHLENVQPGSRSTLEKHRDPWTEVVRFDFSSVMLYGPDAFSFNGQRTLLPKAEYRSKVGFNWGINHRAAAGLRGVSFNDVQKVELMYLSPADRVPKYDPNQVRFDSMPGGLLDQAALKLVNIPTLFREKLERTTPIKVAVLSSGVNLFRATPRGETLEGHLKERRSLVAHEGANDHRGFGTMDASLIAIIAPKSQILSLNIYSKDGRVSREDLISALEWAQDQGARVVVLNVGSKSYGGESYPPDVEDLLARLRRNGLLVFVGAGNDKGAVFTPANCPHAVAVGATNLSDTPSATTNKGPELDLAAPGVDVVAVGFDGTYRKYQGTASASTIAASVAALVLSVRPDLSADDVEDILKQSAKKVDWEDERVKAGRVDALAAVRMAKTYKTSKK